MRRTWPLLTFIAAAALSVGCADSDPQIQLRGSATFAGELDNEGMTPVLQCQLTLDAEADDTIIFFTGELDLTELSSSGQIGPTGFGGIDKFDYVALATNSLQRNSGTGQTPTDLDNLRVDTNTIEIQEATVRFPPNLNQFPGGIDSALLDDFYQDSPRFLSAVLNTLNTTVFPIGIISSPAEKQLFEQFHAQLAGDDPSISFTLITELQAFGETISGNSVESNVVRWPITFCRNCGTVAVTPTCLATQ